MLFSYSVCTCVCVSVCASVRSTVGLQLSDTLCAYFRNSAFLVLVCLEREKNVAIRLPHTTPVFNVSFLFFPFFANDLLCANYWL